MKAVQVETTTHHNKEWRTHQAILKMDNAVTAPVNKREYQSSGVITNCWQGPCGVRVVDADGIEYHRVVWSDAGRGEMVCQFIDPITHNLVEYEGTLLLRAVRGKPPLQYIPLTPDDPKYPPVDLVSFEEIRKDATSKDHQD